MTSDLLQCPSPFGLMGEQVYTFKLSTVLLLTLAVPRCALHGRTLRQILPGLGIYLLS